MSINPIEPLIIPQTSYSSAALVIETTSPLRLNESMNYKLYLDHITTVKSDAQVI